MMWHGHESCLLWSCHSHQILLPLSALAWSARLQEGRAYASRFGPRHISRRQDALWCAKFTFSMLRQKGQTCTGKGQKKVTKKRIFFFLFLFTIVCSLGATITHNIPHSNRVWTISNSFTDLAAGLAKNHQSPLKQNLQGHMSRYPCQMCSQHQKLIHICATYNIIQNSCSSDASPSRLASPN